MTHQIPSHRRRSSWRTGRCAKALSGATILGAIALAAALGSPVAGAPLAPGSYVVVSGDTLSAISARYGVTVSALASANGISNPNFIVAGSTLVIPTATGGAGSGVPGASQASQSDPHPAVLSSYPDRLELLSTFDQAAAAAGIPPSLLKAITWQESGWQAGVVSSAGAIGIGQLTPDTVAFVRTVLDPAPLDPWVAADNISLTAQFLRYLLNQTGWNEELAIAAYYQGLGSATTYGILPQSEQYVADVMALQTQF